jgi:hypothetical protein
MAPRPFPPAQKHGELSEVFPGIFFVQGTVKMPGPPARFSRNMTVIRHEGELTLVNSIRLDEAGLAKLDALGKVKHVVRLAGFHGLDDPFYKDRYGATMHAVRGQVYAAGFDNAKGASAETYFQADVLHDDGSALPFPGARLFVFDGKVPEGLLHLDRDGGILIAGDALQNWDRVDEYFNFLASLMMRMMGFIKPHNVGPGWLKEAAPSADRLAAVLDLEFAHVLPAHGAVVRGDAREKFRPVIEATVAKLRG